MDKILILGYVIQDLNLMEYPPVPSHTFQALPKTVQVIAPGGVRYLRDLINKMMPDKSAEIQCPDDARETNSIKVFNTWKQFAKVPNDKGKKVWRIERIIGRTELDRESCKECLSTALAKANKTDVLIIENLGLGCLESFVSEKVSLSSEEPSSIEKFLEKTNQIILKLSSLNSKLPFLEIPNCSDKMTVILAAHTLRERGAAISEGLSWDQTIEDTVKEFESGRSDPAG